MKKRIRLKGRIRTYIQFTLYLGLLLLAIDAAVFMLDFRAGLLTFGFTIFYFAITLTLYFYNKPIIMNELISFATEYGQIQRKLLRDLELPYALLDDSGKVIWTNIAFEDVVLHAGFGFRLQAVSEVKQLRDFFLAQVEELQQMLHGNSLHHSSQMTQKYKAAY